MHACIGRMLLFLRKGCDTCGVNIVNVVNVQWGAASHAYCTCRGWGYKSLHQSRFKLWVAASRSVHPAVRNGCGTSSVAMGKA